MKKGYGVSFGAISVLNAIPCGVGSTIGINLRTEAVFEESDGTDVDLVDRPEVSGELASHCVKKTLEKIGKKIEGYNLTVTTEIPHSIGLKSSSSVCNAVISAVLDAYDIVWDEVDIVRFGVKCARECGVTITGAFDDACGCMFGGLIVSDNNRNEILLMEQVPEYDVIICLPDKKTVKTEVNLQRYRKYYNDFEALVSRIEDDYLNVLVENGRLVGEISGLKDLSQDAIDAGALAAGFSGTGPAIAVVAKKNTGKEIAKKLKCKTILAKTRSCISFVKSEVTGTIIAPPSKSHSHRAIVMASLSEGISAVYNCLSSEDVKATIDAMKNFGAEIDGDGHNLTVHTEKLHAVNNEINVGNSGSTLRFAIGVASLLDSEIKFDGDESIRNRTVGPLLDALTNCNVECKSNEGKTPITIKGPIECARITVDGSESSQFVSSVLMIAPIIGNKVEVEITGCHVSEPYVEMTVSMMKQFGIGISKTKKGYILKPGRYKEFDYTVPGDYSSAAYLMAAGCLSGNVTVCDLETKHRKGDGAIVDILESMGCSVTVDGDSVTCSKSDLTAVDIDLKDNPDLFPVLAVMLSVAKGTSRLYGAPHLRNKESDRISTTVKMLSALGADIVETDDGCVINGVDSLKGGRIEHKGDHRVMMAAVVASLVSERPVTMDDDGCWKTSYPDFIHDMESIGVQNVYYGK